MTTNATSTENLDQTIVQGTVQGALFKLPAGDVRMAVLGAWRENTYEYNPNSDLAAQNIEAVLASLPAMGDIDVSELALQFEVPCSTVSPWAPPIDCRTTARRAVLIPMKAISNGGRSIHC